MAGVCHEGSGYTMDIETDLLVKAFVQRRRLLALQYTLVHLIARMIHLKLTEQCREEE